MIQENMIMRIFLSKERRTENYLASAQSYGKLSSFVEFEGTALVLHPRKTEGSHTMWVKRGIGFLLGAFLPLGWCAAGATVDLQFVNVNPGDVVQVSFNGTTPTGGGVGTGSYNFNVINNSDPSVNPQIIAGSTLVAFCMEGNQPVAEGTATYTVLGPNPPSIPNVGLLDAFFNQYYSLASIDSVHSAAFQLDVWELIYDGLSNQAGSSWFTSGTFRANPSVAEDTLARGWLDGFNTSTTGPLFLYQLSNPVTQDFVFGVASNGAIPSPDTPLPAAFPGGAALIVSLGALAGIKKFRRRNV